MARLWDFVQEVEPFVEQLAEEKSSATTNVWPVWSLADCWDRWLYYDVVKCFHKSPKHNRDPVDERERAVRLRDEIDAILRLIKGPKRLLQ
jgi:hypothetical protein